MLSNLIKYNTLFNIEIKSEKIIEYYLNSCKFIGVSSPSFNKKYNTIKDGVLCPEEAKVIALNNFINKINKYGEIVNGDVNIGFSDDDPSNVNSVIKHFGEISELYKNISFNVIDTSDPNIIGGIKKRI